MADERPYSSIVVDGVEVPYRPVKIITYHMAQQELGFQTARAMTMVPMLVGATGAVGGQLSDFTWKIHKNYPKFEKLTVEDPPYDFILNKSKYFPINTGFPGMVAKVMIDPERYGVEELPEVAILHYVNPLNAFPSQQEYLDSYGKFKFVAVVSPWMSETADYFADVVLPAATIEKYEGPISATDQYIDAKTLRIPPMEPLFESKGEIRTSLCTPDSVFSQPNALRPLISTVADLMPASSPGLEPMISTLLPRASAQRVYMRRSIWAQSWLSVPPAPAWISR